MRPSARAPRSFRTGCAAALALAALAAAPGSGQAQDPRAPVPAASMAQDVKHADGRMPNGNLWAAEVPANWNGVLLLNSHGYAPGVRAPSYRGRAANEWFLNNGYAIAGSSYSKGGWALAEA